MAQRNASTLLALESRRRQGTHRSGCPQEWEWDAGNPPRRARPETALPRSSGLPYNPNRLRRPRLGRTARAPSALIRSSDFQVTRCSIRLEKVEPRFGPRCRGGKRTSTRCSGGAARVIHRRKRAGGARLPRNRAGHMGAVGQIRTSAAPIVEFGVGSGGKTAREAGGGPAGGSHSPTTRSLKSGWMVARSAGLSRPQPVRDGGRSGRPPVQGQVRQTPDPGAAPGMRAEASLWQPFGNSGAAGSPCTGPGPRPGR